MLFYMIESRNTSKNLWNRNPQYRDNSVVTIGIIFRVLSLSPIKTIMANDIPMLETRFSVVIMRQSRENHESIIQQGLSGNSSKSFLLNDCTITINSSIHEETTCSGCLCDKQRIQEIA